MTTSMTTFTTTLSPTSVEAEAQRRQARITDLATELTNLYHRSNTFNAKKAFFENAEEPWTLQLEDISSSIQRAGKDEESFG